MPSLDDRSRWRRRIFGPAGIFLLAMTYLLTGVTGHDLWRGEDARHFAPILSLLDGDNLWFAYVAGERVDEGGMLYYWTGALFASLAGGYEPHQAARLASALFGGLTLWWIGLAARARSDAAAQGAAMLLLIGTLGLVVHVHLFQPLLALMAVQAGLLTALLRDDLPERGRTLAIAAALTAGFLTAGILPALSLGATTLLALMLPTATTALRRSVAGGLTLAILVVAAWFGLQVWQNPQTLAAWHAGQLLLPSLGDAPAVALFSREAGWFLWPLWPLMLWSLWHQRGQLLLPQVALPLLLWLASAGWIVVSSPSDDPSALLPLLVPSALLASNGLMSLRRGANNALDWFARMSFAVFALLMWCAWSAQTAGWPPGLRGHIARFGDGYVPPGALLPALVAAVVCLISAVLIWTMPRSTLRGAANWAVTMTCLWVLAVWFLQPWFDHTASYRRVMTSLNETLATHVDPDDCIASLGLPRDIRGALHYFAGQQTERMKGVPPDTHCRWLIVYTGWGALPTRIDAPWTRQWHQWMGGGRRTELFELYRHDPIPHAP